MDQKLNIKAMIRAYESGMSAEEIAIKVRQGLRGVSMRLILNKFYNDMDAKRGEECLK